MLTSHSTYSGPHPQTKIPLFGFLRLSHYIELAGLELAV